MMTNTESTINPEQMWLRRGPLATNGPRRFFLEDCTFLYALKIAQAHFNSLQAPFFYNLRKRATRSKKKSEQWLQKVGGAEMARQPYLV